MLTELIPLQPYGMTKHHINVEYIIDVYCLLQRRFLQLATVLIYCITISTAYGLIHFVMLIKLP